MWRDGGDKLVSRRKGKGEANNEEENRALLGFFSLFLVWFLCFFEVRKLR